SHSGIEDREDERRSRSGGRGAFRSRGRSGRADADGAGFQNGPAAGRGIPALRCGLAKPQRLKIAFAVGEAAKFINSRTSGWCLDCLRTTASWALVPFFD